MKWILALVAACTLACGGKVIVDAPEIEAAPAVNTDKTMQLLGRGGIAHACPVDGVIYTAAHVVEEVLDSGAEYVIPGYSFSTREGNRGIVIPASINTVRDLAILYLQRGAVNYYKAGPAPVNDAKVYWREYSWGEEVLSKSLVESTVAYTIAGHFVLTDEPEGGASGGCLFNEDGEVIGVVTWGLYGYGVAVSIVGYWSL